MHANQSMASHNSAAGINFLWLEITSKCNLSCVHCYADSGPHEELLGAMKFEDWTSVMKEARELGCAGMQFIGGEPSLHPRIIDMLDYAGALGFTTIEFFTNATRMTDPLLRALKRNGVRCACSFYSADPKVHARITTSESSFHKTVAGIRRILAAGLPLRVGVIEMDENRGEVGTATVFLQGLGVQNIGSDSMRGVGRANGTFPTQINLQPEKFDQLCGACWQGKLCVTASGMTYPCVMSRATHLGSAKGGLREIIEGKKLSIFRSRMQAESASRLPSTLHSEQAEGSCFPSCGPDQWCSPSVCTPGSGPCYPVECSPALCYPQTGPCSPHACMLAREPAHA